MPDVGHRRLRLGEQQSAEHRAAVGPQPRRAVLGEYRDMGAEPGRVMAAAGKAPGSGQAVAARRHSRLGWSGRAPGDDPASPAENLGRHLGRQIGRGHRAAAGLADAPGDAGVVPGDFFDHRHILCWRQLGAAERARQQQAKEPGFGQRRDQRLGQLAAPLDLIAGGRDRRPERAGAIERVLAGPVDALRARRVRPHPWFPSPRRRSGARSS